MMIKVDGFLFEDKEMAQIARREEEGIRYIKQRTALDNPEVVLKLYKKLLEQDIFVTPVGIRFLSELQNILLDSEKIAGEDIPSIPVKAVEYMQKAESVEKSVKKPEKEDSKVGKDYRKPFIVSTFFAVVLGFSVIGMFAINALSGNNINIINYREQILNEYSSWEAELKAEEERLEKWEESLQEREEKIPTD